MKKLLILAALFLGISLSVQSQYFTIGPKAGVSFSKFTTDQSEIKALIRDSHHFGLFMRAGNRIYIQPELLLMNRNGKLLENHESGSKTLHIRTIDLPVMLGGKLISTGCFNVRAMAGPVASLAVFRDVDNENWEDDSGRKDIRCANCAVQAGVGVDLMMFTIDLRYEFGLSDFSKSNGLVLKNNLISLSLGWKIL